MLDRATMQPKMAFDHPGREDRAVATRLVVVGGGVIGTMHAYTAVERGWEVVQLERDAAPRGASGRNFGLVWVSGRAPGTELELALRARARWQEIGAACAGVGFRPNGSLTVAQTDEEWAVLEEVAARPDAAGRGFSLLDAEEARRCNRALGGAMVGALHCALDAVVEPRMVCAALRRACEASGRYEFLAPREIVGIRDHAVVDAQGDVHGGDRVVLCVGAAHGGAMAEVLSGAPLQRVRLQMLETEPFAQTLPTSVADGDSLRYYPAFAGPARDALPPQDPVAARWAAQLLLVQRLDGSLTIGDTHSMDEPFAFDVDEEPYTHLLAVAHRLLGIDLPKVVRRWAGVYSRLAPDADAGVYLRLRVAAGVEVVTGLGGRGMTLSPAVAEETLA
jgi:FAD dependent oxidoreductase TIGR03364